MSKINFSYEGTSATNTKIIGKSRDFEIIVDEPPSLGGNDDAPNPVEYTLASLAGYINVVAHVIAKELDFTINSLSIKVDGEINPNRFLNGDKTDRAGFSNITVTLDLDSDADDALKDKWLAIVKDRCPVTDNLANSTPVEIQL